MPRHEPEVSKNLKYKKDFIGVANDYAKRVVSGKEIACKWTILTCKRHLDDLKKARSDKTYPYYFDRDLGSDVCDFAEKLPHIEGKWPTPTIILEPWQVFCLSSIFGWRKKSDGNRRFTKVYWEVARKNAKSTIAAVISLYCFTCEAEPAPYVFIGATTGAQAQKVFHPARKMVEKTPALQEAFGLKVWARSVTEPGGGYIQTINSKGSTNDGHNPHLSVLDELHAHKDRALYDVMDSASGARDNPLMWIITTAGFDTAGVCYEQRLFVTKLLEGIVSGDHYFGIIYTLDDEDVVDIKAGKLNRKAWKKANPNLGVSVRVDNMERAAEEALAQPGKMGEFLTKRLNVWTTGRNAHINVARWQECDGFVPLHDLLKVDAFLGFDLASTSDLTSVRLVWKVDGVLYTFGFRYLPEAAVNSRSKRNGVPYNRWANMPLPCTENLTGDLASYLKPRRLLTVTPGDTVDYSYIEKDIRWLFSVFKVRLIGYDPYNATDLVNRLKEDSLPLGIVRQGAITLSGPMKELDRLYLNGNLAHGGDEALSWCASNVVPRPDHNENLAPSKTLSLEKIDDYSAMLNGIAAMLSVEKQPKSFWEAEEEADA
jgi:phage terminase large subunit-like protein